MPGNNMYMSSISEENLLGGQPPLYSTTIEPLPIHPYFRNKWNEELNKWEYVDAPLEPGMREHPLDRVLTYADCRRMEYPVIEDYIDGMVKNDTEQVQHYIDKCMEVKATWQKTMEPITLRQYYHQKLNLHINNNNATQEEGSQA